ncbi:MAG TPA: hypothetical protein VFE84_08240 [Patescibacteria group bacterium]|nr:hypothetical protein [Patescibacteria group bacterium]
MKRASLLLVAAGLLAGLPACSHRQTAPPLQTVMVPPLIDLKQHETIGVIEFRSSSDGKLGQLATRRFTEWARRDQGLVRIVDLGPRAKALRSVGRDQWGPETYKALGEQRGVSTLLIGELKVSDVRPDVKILASLGSGQVTAQVDATLEVQLIETATGASLWNASASGTKNVGHVSVFSGRRFAFDADDPENAYGVLVDALVEQTTRDFRVSWERH